MKTSKFKTGFSIGVTAILLFFVFFGSIPTRAFAQKKVIRIGYVPGYCVITDPEAMFEKGYGYEYFEEIAKYTGWTYEYISCTWAEGFNMLKSGQIDIFGPLQKNAQREAEYSYPEHEMGYEYGSLFIDASNTKYNFGDAKSFDGMRIGTEENNFFIEQLLAYCDENGIKVELVYTDMRNNAEELKQGKYDAVLHGNMMEIPGSKMALKMSIEPFYFVTSENNKKLRDQLDDALHSIEMSDMGFASKLYEKYNKRNPVNLPAFSKEEKLFIEQNPVIQVAADPDWIPISYSGKDEYEGISVDTLQEIGNICGLKFDFLQVEDYLECKQMLSDGKVSLILPHTELASDLGVHYTDSFYQVSTMLVGVDEIDINKPLRIGVSNIQSQPAEELMNHYPHLEMIAYPNINELLASLYSGKEQYIFVNTYVYDEVVRKVGNGVYRATPTDITYPLRFGVSLHSDPALLSLLNKAIRVLSEGQVDSIVFANTVNRAYQKPLSLFLKENMYVILISLALLFTALVLLVVIVNRNIRKKLERVAFVDELTHLPSFAKFQIDAREELRNLNPADFYLVSLDIDNFKYINDLFGYEMGNKILKCLAEHFKKYPKSYKHLARSNADNFIFLIYAKDKAEAISRFSELLNIGDDVHALLPLNYSLVLSAGLYQLTSIDEDFASCCDKANIARKSVKGSHINTLREYTDEMDSRMRWKKEVTLSMENALENGDFLVYLQPKYRFSDERLGGAEALVRWNHPQNGLLMPLSFIPLFEHNGFILKLDYYMFTQVCILIREWMDLGLFVPPISVNLSRLHLANPHLVEDLAAIANQYEIPPGMLEIELTESIVLDDPQTLIKIMKDLKQAGFDISVDDFGNGYSSLSLLTDLPVDILKLDKGFLRRTSEIGKSRLIVEQVVELAKKLNLSVVAEGVETKDQVKFLKDLGCDMAQGYFYDRPMPPKEFEEKLRKYTK